MENNTPRRIDPLVILVIILALCLVCILIGKGASSLFGPEDTTPISTAGTLPEATTAPETTAPTTETTAPPFGKVSTATIGTTGDILMHELVIKSGYDSASGTYNYDNIFDSFAPYASRVDWGVANLEVTLCGDDNGYNYSGYPNFNCPDAITDALKKAGFDMLLTANNHSFDTRQKGFDRTQQIVADRGFAHIGTRPTEDAKNYLIKEVNGITIGMTCYTYNTGYDSKGNASLNTIPLTTEANALTNSFSYNKLDEFYQKLSGELEQMRQDGAEAIMLFSHWGDEYQIKENTTQRKMAQALCNLGIDVIVGNHAHVVQPVSLLTNENDDSKKTLCLYSTGNSVSNIYKTERFPVHTEDGMLFCVTFAKYTDGTVLVDAAKVIPTWVYRYPDPDTGVGLFRILAMDGAEENWNLGMDVSDSVKTKCKESYDRTMDIVGEGLTAANDHYTAQANALLEANAK